MLLFNLDINNICASGGSACASGAEAGSHVIRAINNNPNQITVRFSFCKHNTKEEVDVVIQKLKEVLQFHPDSFFYKFQLRNLDQN